jgi:hypothetical protein
MVTTRVTTTTDDTTGGSGPRHGALTAKCTRHGKLGLLGPVSVGKYKDSCEGLP